MTTVTRPTPEELAAVPPPAGATEVAEWGPTPDPDRYFRGTTQVIDRADDEYNDDVVVEVWGVQTPAGEVRRHVDVAEGGYERLTFSSAAHARAFGEALIAAADEVEKMTEYDHH